MKAADFLEQFQSAASVVGLHQPVVIISDDGYQVEVTGADFSFGRVVVNCDRIVPLASQSDLLEAEETIDEWQMHVEGVKDEIQTLMDDIKTKPLGGEIIIERLDEIMNNLPVNT